jgi:acyl-CoA reductase-like NAD-dependent aldehyde dehydrogenase
MWTTNSLTAKRFIHPIVASLVYLALGIGGPLALLNLDTPAPVDMQRVAQTTDATLQLVQATIETTKENGRLIDEALAAGDKASLERAQQKARANLDALEKLRSKFQEQQDDLATRRAREQRNPPAKKLWLAILMGLPFLFWAIQSFTSHLRSTRVCATQAPTHGCP